MANLPHRLVSLAALAILLVLPARAQLSVQSSLSPSGEMFHFSYTLSNQTETDVAIVTLTGLPAVASAVVNLTAPEGFLASFDATLGLLSFFEGTQTFNAGSLVGAFEFDSAFGGGPGRFEALTVTGETLTGRTDYVPMSPVPEPSTTALLGAVLLLIACASRPLFRRFHHLPFPSTPCTQN